MLLRFTLTDGDTVHVDPYAVDFVREVTAERTMDGGGDPVAVLGVGGEEFAVSDDGRKAAGRIRRARRRLREA